MKIMKFLSTLLVIVATSVYVSSCSKDEDDSTPPTSIIGSWTQTNKAETVVIILKFNTDKTGTINYTYSDGSGDMNENFEYDYIDSDRSLTIIGSQLKGNYDVILTATKLVLSNDKLEYEFTKVK